MLLNACRFLWKPIIRTFVIVGALGVSWAYWWSFPQPELKVVLTGLQDGYGEITGNGRSLMWHTLPKEESNTTHISIYQLPHGELRWSFDQERVAETFDSNSPVDNRAVRRDEN